MRTERSVTHWEGSGIKIRALAWLEEGDSLAAGGEDGKVRIYDLSGEEARLSAENNIQTRRLRSLSINPEGDKLAAAGDFNKINLLDSQTADIVGELAGHGYHVSEVDWSPNMEYLASSAGGHLLIWPLFMEN